MSRIETTNRRVRLLNSTLFRVERDTHSVVHAIKQRPAALLFVLPLASLSSSVDGVGIARTVLLMTALSLFSIRSHNRSQICSGQQNSQALFESMYVPFLQNLMEKQEQLDGNEGPEPKEQKLVRAMGFVEKVEIPAMIPNPDTMVHVYSVYRNTLVTHLRELEKCQRHLQSDVSHSTGDYSAIETHTNWIPLIDKSTLSIQLHYINWANTQTNC